MKRQLLLTSFLVAVAIVTVQIASFAQHGDRRHRPPAPAAASVDYGVVHSIAIYRVDKHTTRDEVGQFLCPGEDPADSPDFHPCLTAGPLNAAARHVIYDGDGDVVIVAQPNVTSAHPDNRVWSTPGRLMSAGGHQVLNGGTIPAGATSNGQLVTHPFLKSGRYLVICMNRSHFLNDWMFGFVNVTDDQH